MTERGSAALCNQTSALVSWIFTHVSFVPVLHGLIPSESPRWEFLPFGSGLVPDDSGANFSVMLSRSCTQRSPGDSSTSTLQAEGSNVTCWLCRDKDVTCCKSQARASSDALGAVNSTDCSLQEEMLIFLDTSLLFPASSCTKGWGRRRN